GAKALTVPPTSGNGCASPPLLGDSRTSPPVRGPIVVKLPPTYVVPPACANAATRPLVVYASRSGSFEKPAAPGAPASTATSAVAPTMPRTVSRARIPARTVARAGGRGNRFGRAARGAGWGSSARTERLALRDPFSWGRRLGPNRAASHRPE